MHHHNQTLADLEREATPGTWALLAALACIAAGLYLACAVLFSL